MTDVPETTGVTPHPDASGTTMPGPQPDGVGPEPLSIGASAPGHELFLDGADPTDDELSETLR